MIEVEVSDDNGVIRIQILGKDELSDEDEGTNERQDGFLHSVCWYDGLTNESLRR